MQGEVVVKPAYGQIDQGERADGPRVTQPSAAASFNTVSVRVSVRYTIQLAARRRLNSQARTPTLRGFG